MHDHTDFDLAFTDARTVIDDGGRVAQLHVVHAGYLAVTTGRIVACDPYSFEGEAFTTTVPIGSHPVLLSIATYEASEHSERDERVACALLRCTEATPICWEPALTPEQDPTDVGAGALFGYNVNAGTGCFVDAALLDAWSQARDARTEGADPEFWEKLDTWNDRLLEEWFENGARLWADIPMVEYGGTNLIAFVSGWGDGCYGSFIGYDAQGHVTSIATDFGLLLDARTLA